MSNTPLFLDVAIEAAAQAIYECARDSGMTQFQCPWAALVPSLMDQYRMIAKAALQASGDSIRDTIGINGMREQLDHIDPNVPTLAQSQAMADDFHAAHPLKWRIDLDWLWPVGVSQLALGFYFGWAFGRPSFALALGFVTINLHYDHGRVE